MAQDPIAVVASLVEAFDRLGVRYFVGGSFASSMYGVPRATQDVDVVADMDESDAEPFAALLSGRFYVDVDMIKEAIRSGRAFNVIHLETMFKADVFGLGAGPWPREQMAGARTEAVPSGGGSIDVRFASPEDTVLHKLIWYHMGGETSERQWSDVLGILQVQGDDLDEEYLRKWAAHLEVADLLARAMTQHP